MRRETPHQRRARNRLRLFEQNAHDWEVVRAQALEADYMLQRIAKGRDPYQPVDLNRFVGVERPLPRVQLTIAGFVAFALQGGKPGLVASKRELAALCRCSPSGVDYAVARLLADGWVEVRWSFVPAGLGSHADQPACYVPGQRLLDRLSQRPAPILPVPGGRDLSAEEIGTQKLGGVPQTAPRGAPSTQRLRAEMAAAVEEVTALLRPVAQDEGAVRGARRAWRYAYARMRHDLPGLFRWRAQASRNDGRPPPGVEHDIFNPQCACALCADDSHGPSCGCGPCTNRRLSKLGDGGHA